MRRIKDWVNRLSVKKKLIFYGYVIITPVLLIICLVLLVNNYNNELEERMENDISSLNNLADSVNVLQTDVKDFSTYICINNEINRLLAADAPEVLNENSKLWLEDAPMQIVQDMISLKGHIKTIAIYTENGVRPYLRCMDGSAYLSDMEEIRASDIYRETLNSDSGMVWKYVPKGRSDTYETNRFDKVVLYRRIPDRTQKKTLGYIVIGVSQERFVQLCQGIVRDEGESAIILDKNGGELGRAGNLDSGLEAYLKREEFVKANYRDRETYFSYGEFDVVCRQMDKNASIVCKVVPRYGLQLQLLDIVYMPVTLLIGMLAGLLPLLVIISNLVTRPLRQVSEAIRKFSTGDFEQQVEVTTRDEVGEVAECFNRMVEDIRQQIDENYVMAIREKESELAALQAQINPHFLYNTLDSLYWKAMEEENEEIAESILALSQLFRLVISQGKREITVGQEIELVSRYLQIQKMRFSKRLNYEIDVAEDVQRARIPKLILQPFVENAVVHGFENVSTACHLRVTGKREGGFIRFEIQDTGIGMRQDQIDAIWEEEPAQYAKQRIGRYAIKNIRERLVLKYHDDFKLEIRSDVGKGTTVVLVVPFEEDV